MNFFEPYTHSFIVKIWLEETIEETGQAEWRGYITHVPSNERRYVRNMNEIAVFVAPYLEAMGVKLGSWWRVRVRLRRLWMCMSRALLR
jgi:hypothetical protein